MRALSIAGGVPELPPAPEPALPAVPAADPPLLIEAHLGRLILGPQRQVRNVSAHLSRAGDHWQAARIDARFAKICRSAEKFENPAESDLAADVDDPLGSVVESQKQPISVKRPGFNDIFEHSPASSPAV